jgi:hypothetical protein
MGFALSTVTAEEAHNALNVFSEERSAEVSN